MRIRRPFRLLFVASPRARGEGAAALCRPRRGAVAAMVGLLMVALIGIMALAVDFGRLGNLKADLQTAADAAALAGAVELIDTLGRDPTLADDVAATYVGLNPAMQAAVTVDAVECGLWIDASSIYGPASCDAAANAVQITVSRQSSGLFMSALGVSPPIVRATSRAAVVANPLIPAPDPCDPSINCRAYLVQFPP